MLVERGIARVGLGLGTHQRSNNEQHQPAEQHNGNDHAGTNDCMVSDNNRNE